MAAVGASRFPGGATVNTGLLIVIVVAVVIIALLAVVVARRRRSQGLQSRFGPEYPRAVARADDRRAAESQLAEREQRHRRLDIVELEPAARARYQEAWRAAQGRFVDDPATATGEADALVTEVLRERGYPVEDFDQQADDVSVDHPDVVENYRAAHVVARANGQGLASTDDLRQAFVHYRSLFAELLGTQPDGHREEAQ
jgi:FtsZ-interacting cell division protein ZipA